MSQNESNTQTGAVKAIEGAVKHCMNCGVEFYPALKSSVPIECTACGSKFAVRVHE